MSEAALQDLSILIPAAGQGERLGLGPKALLRIGGRSLLSWVSAKALRCAGEVLVAAPPGRCGEWAAECPGCRVIEGSGSHLLSLAALVRASTRPWVLNLNVSLPFVSTLKIHEVTAAARVTGIAGAFLEADLPVARVAGGLVSELIPRREAGLAQGPNAYGREILLRLIEGADERDWAMQSFLEVALRRGLRVAAVPGDRNNIKVTCPEDWALAQHLAPLLP